MLVSSFPFYDLYVVVEIIATANSSNKTDCSHQYDINLTKCEILTRRYVCKYVHVTHICSES